MEIRPASLAQITKARNGKYVEVGDDVQGVANALHEIDPHIRLRYSEAGEYFVVYWSENPHMAEEDGGENTTYLIFTAQDLDHRIVHRMAEVYWKCNKPGYSFADELDKQEAEAKKQKDHEFTERNGENYERLAHALRKELGYDQHRIYVPTDLAA